MHKLVIKSIDKINTKREDSQPVDIFIVAKLWENSLGLSHLEAFVSAYDAPFRILQIASGWLVEVPENIELADGVEHGWEDDMVALNKSINPSRVPQWMVESAPVIETSKLKLAATRNVSMRIPIEWSYFPSLIGENDKSINDDAEDSYSLITSMGSALHRIAAESSSILPEIAERTALAMPEKEGGKPSLLMVMPETYLLARSLDVVSEIPGDGTRVRMFSKDRGGVYLYGVADKALHTQIMSAIRCRYEDKLRVWCSMFRHNFLHAVDFVLIDDEWFVDGEWQLCGELTVKMPEPGKQEELPAMEYRQIGLEKTFTVSLSGENYVRMSAVLKQLIQESTLTSFTVKVDAEFGDDSVESLLREKGAGALFDEAVSDPDVTRIAFVRDARL